MFCSARDWVRTREHLPSLSWHEAMPHPGLTPSQRCQSLSITMALGLLRCIQVPVAGPLGAAGCLEGSAVLIPICLAINQQRGPSRNVLRVLLGWRSTSAVPCLKAASGGIRQCRLLCSFNAEMQDQRVQLYDVPPPLLVQCCNAGPEGAAV